MTTSAQALVAAAFRRAYYGLHRHKAAPNHPAPSELSVLSSRAEQRAMSHFSPRSGERAAQRGICSSSLVEHALLFTLSHEGPVLLRPNRDRGPKPITEQHRS